MHIFSSEFFSLLDPKLTLRGHHLQWFLMQLPEDVRIHIYLSINITVPTSMLSKLGWLAVSYLSTGKGKIF